MYDYERLKRILANVEFPGKELHLGPMGDGWYVQVRYMEADVDTGEPMMQHARKWYISPHATETEVVETVFEALCRSALHQVKEHFRYKCARVYSPHFSIDGRVHLCVEKAFDRRS